MDGPKAGLYRWKSMNDKIDTLHWLLFWNFEDYSIIREMIENEWEPKWNATTIRFWPCCGNF